MRFVLQFLNDFKKKVISVVVEIKDIDIAVFILCGSSVKLA